MSRARPLLFALVLGLCVPLVGPAQPSLASTGARTPPKWIRRIETVVGNRPVSVAIGQDSHPWLRHLAWVERAPASNEKLLLSMALFDRFAPTRTIWTSARAAKAPDHGVIAGDLWLVGHGDPELDDRDLIALARKVADAGVTRIRGSVIGATGPFRRDWWATGWKDYFPADYIARPTALTFRRNVDAAGHHLVDPERRAALVLTARLEALGVQVGGDADMGPAPAGLSTMARIASAPLQGIVRRMDLHSRNLWAEVLGKYLGAAAYGAGTIANGARAICAFTSAHGLSSTCHDGSGLSYANRETAYGLLRLLWAADRQPWGATLRTSLPSGGQGTLEDRLTDVRLRAKTGTLDNVSALSGWVWLERSGTWAEFSIMSSGFDEYEAKKIENQIVRVVSENASDPAR